MKHPIVYSWISDPNQNGTRKVRLTTQPDLDGALQEEMDENHLTPTKARVAYALTSWDDNDVFPSCHSGSGRGLILQGNFAYEETDGVINWLCYGE